MWTVKGNVLSYSGLGNIIYWVFKCIDFSDFGEGNLKNLIFSLCYVFFERNRKS